jgi:hypothetical protein
MTKNIKAKQSNTKIHLYAYTVRVYKINNTSGKKKQHKKDSEPCKLSCFNNRDDLYQVMLSAFKSIDQNGYRFEDDAVNNKFDIKNYIKLDRYDFENMNRSISGILEHGIYGISSKIVDVNTDNVNYKKQKDDTDILPSYFLMHIPEDRDEGILILQQTGKHSIREILEIFIKRYFSNLYPDFDFEINHLVSEELIKKALYKGTIKSLRCVKHQAPRDIVDGLDEEHEEKPFNLEIVLSGKKIPFMDTIKKFLDPNSKSDIKRLIEFRGMPFDYDTIKVDVDIEGSKRTFDLNDLEQSQISCSISQNSFRETDEKFTYNSIDEFAQNYLQEILNEMYP